jgi:hypothetical protein
VGSCFFLGPGIRRDGVIWGGPSQPFGPPIQTVIPWWRRSRHPGDLRSPVDRPAELTRTFALLRPWDDGLDVTWAGAWIIVLASGADIAGPSQARSSGPGVIFHDPPRSAHLSHPLGKRLCTPFPRPQCRGLRAWLSSDELPAGPGKRCAFPGEMYAPVEGHGPLVRVPKREARSSPWMGEGDREAVEWVTFMKT